MLPNEKSELVGYLKKETKRLRNAIQQAEAKNQYGKAAHHRQSLDAYQKFLENIFSESKPPFLLIAVTLFAILSRLASAEAQETKLPANKILSGKIFAVEIVEHNQDKAIVPAKGILAFSAGKLSAGVVSTNSKEDFISAKFSPGFFYAMVDSTQGGMLLFSSQTKNRSGETLLWIGSVEGSILKGTMIWSDGKTRYKIFSFSGTVTHTNN